MPNNTNCPSPWRRCFYGMDTKMRVKCGIARRAYLNNAATPQVLKQAADCFNQTLPCYAYDNEQNTISENLKKAYNEVRDLALCFVEGDPARDTVIYTANTTTAINLLNHVLLSDPKPYILTTRMEHMANYLPYRQTQGCQTILVKLTPDGKIDMEDYCKKLKLYSGQIKLVAVTGASNITGYIPPYHKMAALAHEHGALFFLDAVQLVQHKPFSMKPHGDPGHIDFLSFDGHKCYTGQSGGVLIGPKAILDCGEPLLYGAGMADFVSECQVVLRSAPERFEAGYPDFLGILSMGAALRFLKEEDPCAIAVYEESLYQYMIQRLREIPGLCLYGPINCGPAVPIASFNMQGLTYQELACRLGFQCGIAVGSGTLGANLYVQDLLCLSDAEAYHSYSCGCGFGLVRASLGLGNSTSDVDRLADALFQISREAGRCVK